jgi:DNA-directed RNA polymerase specialized sigma24 family protein
MMEVPAVSATDAAGISPFAAPMKEKVMDGTETGTQRPRPEPDPKSSLIARAQQGEEAEFFALYELHKTRVYSICLRIAGTAQAAERLTQNVFLEVFRTISVLRNERELSALLGETAVRAALAARRALARQPGPSDGNASEAKQGDLLWEEASQRQCHAQPSSASQRNERLRPRLLELDASPCFWIGNS